MSIIFHYPMDISEEEGSVVKIFKFMRFFENIDKFSQHSLVDVNYVN